MVSRVESKYVVEFNIVDLILGFGLEPFID